MIIITDWFQRLITLESDVSKRNYYIVFTDKDMIGEIPAKDLYILLVKCTYVEAKKYALNRFYNKYESIYLEEEIDFNVKKLHEKIVFNDNNLVYLI